MACAYRRLIMSAWMSSLCTSQAGYVRKKEMLTHIASGCVCKAEMLTRIASGICAQVRYADAYLKRFVCASMIC